MQNLLKKTCLICGKHFEVRKYREKTAKFCSCRCSALFYKPRRKTIPSGKNHPMWKGGHHINTQGYVMIYSPDHPHKDNQNCVREHRLVMEKHLGRYLLTSEVVHHINGIKNDNRLENLELFYKNDHDRFEMMKRGRTGHYKICPVCNNDFYVTPSIERLECCSQSCAKKKQWADRGAASFGR